MAGRGKFNFTTEPWYLQIKEEEKVFPREVSVIEELKEEDRLWGVV